MLPNKPEGWKGSRVQGDAPVVRQHTQCFGRAGESNGNTDQSCSLSPSSSRRGRGKKGKPSAHFSGKASPSGITSKGK